MIWGGADVITDIIIIEIKCMINVMWFNHPETIPPPWFMEALSSMKPVPGAKKNGDCCSSSPNIKKKQQQKKKTPLWPHLVSSYLPVFLFPFTSKVHQSVIYPCCFHILSSYSLLPISFHTKLSFNAISDPHAINSCIHF